LDQPRLEELCRSAKFVDDKPSNQPLIFGLENGKRADEGRKDSAAIDVTDQKRWDVRRAREAEVRDVARS